MVSSSVSVREVKLAPQEVRLVPNKGFKEAGSPDASSLPQKPIGAVGNSQESIGGRSVGSEGSMPSCREGRPLSAPDRPSGRVAGTGGGWSTEPKRPRCDDGSQRGERHGVPPSCGTVWHGGFRPGWRAPTYNGQARTELPLGGTPETFAQGPISADVRLDGRNIAAEAVSPSGLACATRVYPELDGTAVSSWFGCRYVGFPTCLMWLRD